ncbi:amino acid adenylation domain-containing protein [Nocardia sp. 2YAB30]|uniref:non-ribosomal peptide synthetase n=1 Tax=unclassified Nocardia TaxID=2637762 RepID=UPI003F9D35C1
MSTIANDAHRPDAENSDDTIFSADAERAPLSAGQRRAWFVQTRDPEDVTLNVCLAFRLTGALDAPRLRSAVEHVVARHDILHTTYGADADGEPYQVRGRDLPGYWQEHDLADLAEASRERRVEVLARRALGRPFDLTAEAPLRLMLIRTGAAEFVLVLVVHTICWDDDSWSIVRAELDAAYNGMPLPADPAQFVDVAVHGGGDVESDPVAIDYWLHTLRPLPHALELPGRPSAGGASARQTGHRRLDVPAGLVDRVVSFTSDYDVTPFATLLAAYYAVIHRYTATTDFLVAVPVSNRGPSAISVVGYFGNTLLMRARLRPADSFADFVAAVAADCTAAFTNQGVGIDRVVRETNPDRAAGRDGLEELVRVGFGAREGIRGFEFDGIDCAAVEFGNTEAQLPLRLTVVLDQRGVHLEAEYQADKLTQALVDQLLEHFLTLLTSAVADPSRAVGELDLFGDRNRARLLALSHGELVDAPPTTVVELVRRRITATPDVVAVVAPGSDGTPDVELTYRALDRRANRLAHWLIDQGIGAEDIVALRLPTSVEFVVAVLGVLAAGAAYLPVDPANSDERISDIDRDARPRLVLGRVELAAAEEIAAPLPEHPPTDAERVRPLRPDNLAYLVYTSGTTGRPKGVPVSHAALTEHLAGFAAEWGMSAHDRLLQSAPVSFDASLLDLFVTLTVGARLVIPKPDAFHDIPYVAELIARYKVTVLHMVPSTLSTFLMLPEVSEWRALRHVPVGGEALLGEVADRFAGVFDAELRNHYGPTEAVVSATHLTVEGPQGTRIVPIGVPNRNVYVYLLDDRLQLVPSGVVGEIYLGGRQLARGYLNRPGLTAERFVADPFLLGQRLYRTGDLARRDADGVLEFVGRADEQVKVRGYRVELGEVEAAISGHPAVAHCVVVATSDAAIGTMLAAYVVPADGAAVDLEQVRVHAAAVLPDYMLPAAYAVLDAIPLTAHGKLDRKALPQPVRGATRTFREPGSANEIRLAEQYGRILGLDRIGADDSFFDLGGHSLLAHRLVAWIREEFGVELDVRVLFGSPSVAGLAALIESRSARLGRSTRVPALSGSEKWRVVSEWSTGVELTEVPTLAALLGRARGFPPDRVAVRHGDEKLTYGVLAAWLGGAGEQARAVPGWLLTALDAAVRHAEPLVLPEPGAQTIVLSSAALAAAVADRRAVAADHRGRPDPARGCVETQLVDAVWGSVRMCVELLAAVADGATLLVPTDAQRRDPVALAALIAAHAVAHVAVEPPAFIGMTAAVGDASSVRRWDVVGIDWCATLPDIAAGMSASSVLAFGYHVPEYAGVAARGPLDGTRRARPVPGARVLVLDDMLQPVAPGVRGAVYVGGAGLASGHQDACAADRFVADPFVPGGRLFRTGDHARWDPEGWLVLETRGSWVLNSIRSYE